MVWNWVTAVCMCWFQPLWYFCLTSSPACTALTAGLLTRAIVTQGLMDPAAMQQMMQSPLMQQLLNNPELMRNMLQMNPAVREVCYDIGTWLSQIHHTSTGDMSACHRPAYWLLSLQRGIQTCTSMLFSASCMGHAVCMHLWLLQRTPHACVAAAVHPSCMCGCCSAPLDPSPVLQAFLQMVQC